MPHSKKFKSIAVGIATIILVGGAATAFAFWSAAGSGSGAAPIAAGTSTVVVNQVGALDPMAPGVAPQSLSGTFTNNQPGATPVQVASVLASVSSVTSGGVPVTGCSAADFVISGATMTVNALVPIGSNVGSWTGATIAFNSTSANQDACKGAVVTIGYVAQ